MGVDRHLCGGDDLNPAGFFFSFFLGLFKRFFTTLASLGNIALSFGDDFFFYFFALIGLQ